MAPPAKSKVKTLLMKGGGVKGLAFTGALEALQEHGYQFNHFVGTSAGSIAAVLFAAGASPSDVRETLSNLNFREFKDANILQAWFNLLTHGGMYPGQELSNWIASELKARLDIKDSKVTLEDIQKATKKRVQIFTSKSGYGTFVFDSYSEDLPDHNGKVSAAYAVRLSSSIPGVFIPGQHEGVRIYDGGILNTTTSRL